MQEARRHQNHVCPMTPMQRPQKDVSGMGGGVDVDESFGLRIQGVEEDNDPFLRNEDL